MVEFEVMKDGDVGVDGSFKVFYSTYNDKFFTLEENKKWAYLDPVFILLPALKADQSHLFLSKLEVIDKLHLTSEEPVADLKQLLLKSKRLDFVLSKMCYTCESRDCSVQGCQNLSTLYGFNLEKTLNVLRGRYYAVKKSL